MTLTDTVNTEVTNSYLVRVVRWDNEVWLYFVLPQVRMTLASITLFNLIIGTQVFQGFLCDVDTTK